jgi:hypothetical protein
MKDDPLQLSCSSPDRDIRCPELRFLWFSTLPQDIPTWHRIGGEECFCFTLSSLLFITHTHSTSELLATPFNRLEIVIFFPLPPFSAPSSFLIIYPIQFALFFYFSVVRSELHFIFPRFHHSFYSHSLFQIMFFSGRDLMLSL